MGQQRYDILVVGAGMIGAAFAAGLRQSPFTVALLDAGPRPAPVPDDRFDLRVSAISPGTRDVLRDAGAWDRMDPARIGPYRAMHVWDADSRGSIDFDAADLGEPWLGFIVENRLIQNALLASIETAGNIDCRFDAAAAGLEVNDTDCRLLLESGESFTGSLVVGADGAGSWVRRALGIAVSRRLYGERAHVCEVKTEYSHEQAAWQRFLSTGPVAFLPLANGHCSVVWTCDAEAAGEIAALDSVALGQRLEAALGHRLGAVEVLSPVRGFDLSRQRAGYYVTTRGALIGDAAHVVHPLAGQGANLGFGDAWSLSRVLLDAAGRGRDIGSLRVLRRYERWRRSENFSMMRMLDVLHALFAAESGTIRNVRGLGLSMVDRQHWLKSTLARHALGRGPERPVGHNP